jgi:hypothetical protein
METLVFAANILYLVSYLVRDILHLRVLTLIAACCLVAYFYNLDQPLVTVIAWNMFFVGLNVFQLGRLLVDRYGKQAGAQAQQTKITGSEFVA